MVDRRPIDLLQEDHNRLRAREGRNFCIQRFLLRVASAKFGNCGYIYKALVWVKPGKLILLQNLRSGNGENLGKTLSGTVGAENNLGVLNGHRGNL